MMLSEHFSYAEMTVTTTGLDNTPNAEQLARLINNAKNMELVRTAVGRPIDIAPDHSAFRSYAVNKAVRGAQNSAHLTGDATDFTVKGMTNKQICEAIIKAGIKFDQLIDEDHNGVQWVHISFAPTVRGEYLIYNKGVYTVHQ